MPVYHVDRKLERELSFIFPIMTEEFTSKTTTELISARVVKEAVALLKYSDLNVAEIAYGLGFEYPTNFNAFFKKHTGTTPSMIRENIV